MHGQLNVKFVRLAGEEYNNQHIHSLQKHKIYRKKSKQWWEHHFQNSCIV